MSRRGAIATKGAFPIPQPMKKLASEDVDKILALYYNTVDAFHSLLDRYKRLLESGARPTGGAGITSDERERFNKQIDKLRREVDSLTRRIQDHIEEADLFAEKNRELQDEIDRLRAASSTRNIPGADLKNIVEIYNEYEFPALTAADWEREIRRYIDIKFTILYFPLLAISISQQQYNGFLDDLSTQIESEIVTSLNNRLETLKSFSDRLPNQPDTLRRAFEQKIRPERELIEDIKVDIGAWVDDAAVQFPYVPIGSKKNKDPNDPIDLAGDYVLELYYLWIDDNNPVYFSYIEEFETQVVAIDEAVSRNFRAIYPFISNFPFNDPAKLPSIFGGDYRELFEASLNDVIKFYPDLDADDSITIDTVLNYAIPPRPTARRPSTTVTNPRLPTLPQSRSASPSPVPSPRSSRSSSPQRSPSPPLSPTTRGFRAGRLIRGGRTYSS